MRYWHMLNIDSEYIEVIPHKNFRFYNALDAKNYKWKKRLFKPNQIASYYDCHYK